MKRKIESSEVMEFEKKWNDLEVIEFHLLTREIDFVNETTTITIPLELAGQMTW